MGFEHIGNAAIESLDHAIGLGRAWLGQAVLNALICAEQIELVLPRGLALRAGKKTVSEIFSVVGQNLLSFDVEGLVQGFQNCLGVRCRVVCQICTNTQLVARSMAINRSLRLSSSAI